MPAETFDQVRFTSEFACGSGERFSQLGSDHYAVTVPSDPPSVAEANGYDWFFCIGVENLSSEPREVTLDALRPGKSSQNIRWSETSVPVFASTDLGRWYVVDRAEASEGHLDFRVHIDLAVNETVYVSNSLPHPPDRAGEWLSKVASRSPELAEIHVVGKSALGNDICLMSITSTEVPKRARDRVLITSGFHPSEPDWLATTTIILSLLSDEDRWRELLREFVFDFVLQVNPDGAALGKNGCNGRGVNLYWDFRPDDAESSPEARHLWRWIEQHPPQIYLDFHCYVQQLDKDFRPYIRPLSDYARSAQPLVRAIDKRLIALCEGRAVRGPGTNLPSTLAAQITDAFGTITYTKFHIHLNRGVGACQRLGLQMFQAVMDAARAHGPLARTVFPLDGTSRTPAARWLRWREQSPRALRLRALWNAGLRRLGLAYGSDLTSELMSGEAGLASHWRRHLWSQRESAPPAIVVGADAPGAAARAGDAGQTSPR